MTASTQNSGGITFAINGRRLHLILTTILQNSGALRLLDLTNYFNYFGTQCDQCVLVTSTAFQSEGSAATKISAIIGNVTV
jgi:hypothetical protein